MEIYSWEVFSSFDCTNTSESFWSSVEVWVLKPHVLNKRIGGVDIFDVGCCNQDNINICVNHFKNNLISSDSLVDDIKFYIDEYKKLEESKTSVGNIEVCLRLLYPKKGGYFIENIEIILKDKNTNIVTFIKLFHTLNSVLVLNVPYSVQLIDAKLQLLAPTGTKDVNCHLRWLSDVLFPKLIRWMEPDFSNKTSLSNSLIQADKYVNTYNDLKRKYYNSIREVWTESTDPQKFIVEDIAIASYLLVLWSAKPPQRFVDLGCGNGLLVYILNSENHLGIGLDIRARKIWKSYPESTILKECVVSPSLNCTFPDTDWIIGNHSDELTPWIPVITAKSSYWTNFFLLPCCLYDLDGKKYARKCSKLTCYEEYMKYIEFISIKCGFYIDKDRLKIPSTKRNCFISRGRYYSENESTKYHEMIDNFVKSKIIKPENIQIRSPIEKVQNCTQLNKNFLSSVVNKVANFILEKSPSSSDSWREGEFTNLKELISIITPESRKQLKHECGGLQTLLKNHHHVFLVANGRVKLRKPVERKLLPHFTKTKDCWFFLNHPDSCPLTEYQCSYKHNGQGDILSSS